MKELDILDLHKNYANTYEGYNLLGSYNIYIPFYKLETSYEILKDTKLSIIEEYICKCIESGITEISEIKFALGLDDDIMNFYVNQLLQQQYIEKKLSKIELTEESKSLYKKLIKKIPEKEENYVFFDTLKGEYEVDFSENGHKFIDAKAALNDNLGIVLEPRSYWKQFNNNLDDIREELRKSLMINSISNVKVKEKKEIIYHSITMMLFKKQDKYKLICYDKCKIEGIDNSISDVLQKLLENGHLHEVIRENSKINNINIRDILENYDNDIEIVLDEESKEVIEEIKTIVDEPESLKYIMNYEIREKFLEYLDTAKESLYIISPWMNNHIIDEEFILKLEKLLKNNVKVRIIYGISSKEDIHNDFRNKNTDNIAKKLKEMATPYGELFRIEHGQTHEKLVICDEKYYINGSFNFLSYSGETQNKFSRNEGSTYSENKKLIKETIKLRFGE